MQISSPHKFASSIEFKSYILPLVLSFFLVWSSSSGNRLLFERFWSLKELGLITLAFTIASTTWGFYESILSEILYPPFFNYASGSKSQIINFLQLVNFAIPSFNF